MSQLRELLKTWSGRIILLNTFVFVMMSWQSGSIWLPSSEVLLAWGAKDPVLFASGEYWRILTPIFVHIGFIHFLLNTWAIFALSGHVERVLGGPTFLMIYLVSGIMGNVASLLFSLAVSAGASSSVFGMMGAGYFMEHLAGRRLAAVTGGPAPRNVYSGLLVVNIVLGLVIPQIDNSAHFGGLIAGVLLTYGVLCLRPNPVVPMRPWVGRGIFISMLVTALVGIAIAASSTTLFARFLACGEQAESMLKQYTCYDEALRISPQASDARLGRAAVLIRARQWEEAKEDLRVVAEDPNMHGQLHELKSQLLRDHQTEMALWLETLLSPKAL